LVVEFMQVPPVQSCVQVESECDSSLARRASVWLSRAVILDTAAVSDAADAAGPPKGRIVET
jgi:hypothetical protein